MSLHPRRSGRTAKGPLYHALGTPKRGRNLTLYRHAPRDRHLAREVALLLPNLVKSVMRGA